MLTANENAVILNTLKRCFNERIDKEMGNIVDIVGNRIQKATLAAIDSIITPKIDLAVGLINASTGRDASSVMANSERGEHLWISAAVDNVSTRNNALHVFNMKDETRNSNPDEIGELSFSGTLFDRQPHTHHSNVPNLNAAIFNFY